LRASVAAGQPAWLDVGAAAGFPLGGEGAAIVLASQPLVATVFEAIDPPGSPIDSSAYLALPMLAGDVILPTLTPSPTASATPEPTLTATPKTATPPLPFGAYMPHALAGYSATP
jgi:hypothetical protein